MIDVKTNNDAAMPKGNVYLNGVTQRGGGSMIFFDAQTASVTVNSSTRAVYVNSSDQLIFWDGSTNTTLGSSGSIVSFGLDDAYDDGSTINVDALAVTFAGSHATNNVFGLTLTGSSTGNIIDIQNNSSGSKGFDIQGTSDTWSVDATGAAIVTAIAMADNELITLGTGSDATIGWNGSLLNIAGATDFDDAVTTQSTLVVAGGAGSAGVTLTAGELVLSDGAVQITDADNAASLTVTNNTATTIGAAASNGVVEIVSTSLTTGALVNLETTEATLNGGFYLRAWDATAAGSVFTVGEDGRVVITGAAANVLTITLGDISLADGSITVIDADDAASLSVTNDTATSASVFVFAGSGVFTGSTTTSFATLTASGLTTGTVLYLAGDAMTTGKLAHLSADAVTTGNGIELTSTSTALTSGQFVDVNHTVSGTTIGDMTGARLNYELSHTYTQTSGTVAHDYDDFSIKRTMVTTGAGGTMTSAGALIKLETVSTQTAGTLTDSVNGLEIVMDAQSTGDAINVTHSAVTSKALNLTSSATTEDGVVQVTANSVNSGNVAVIDANGLTTGTALLLESSGTIVTTGEMLSVVANSATTATALIRASGTGLTDGWVSELTGGGANITASGGVLNLQGGAATNGAVLQSVTTGAYVAASVGANLFTANSLTTCDVIVVSATSQTTGNGIVVTGGGASLLSGGSVARLEMGAATAGSGLEIVTTGVYVDATDGVLNVTANSATTGNIALVNATATTTGTLLELNATGGTMTTGNYLVCNDAGVDVFAVKRNGHLSSRQTTKPTIAVGTQNGVTAAAVTAGSTDTCGIITTTGTSAAGDTIFTLTFEEAYAIAPVVVIQPANEAASQNADDATSGAYVSSTTTTTFVVTIPGASGSTPSWHYLVMEMGS